MGGRNTRPKVLRVRYKDGISIRSRLIIIDSPRRQKRALKKFSQGRILKVGKVGQDEMQHVGEYNRKPKELMREFRKDKQTKPFLPIKKGGELRQIIETQTT